MVRRAPLPDAVEPNRLNLRYRLVATKEVLQWKPNLEHA
jgi:hypothetical protein